MLQLGPLCFLAFGLRNVMYMSFVNRGAARFIVESKVDIEAAINVYQYKPLETCRYTVKQDCGKDSFCIYCAFKTYQLQAL